MCHRIISLLLVAFFTVVCSPEFVKGQSVDSLLYLIDNELVKDDAEKYDLLIQLTKDIGDAESKIRYCDQAIEIAQRLDIFPAQTYITKGEALNDVGKYELALECYFLAANYFEENEDFQSLGRTYNSMTIVYSHQGNHENEKFYLHKAIKAFEQEKDSFSLSFTLHNFGYLNYSLEEYDTALDAYTKALDLFEKSNSSYEYFVCTGNIGLVYSRLSDFDKARDYLSIAIDTLTQLDDNYALPEFIIEYADILRQTGEYTQAITYASRALEIADNPTYERDASLLLSELYKNSGMFDSAYYYQSLFIVANDSIKNIKSVQEMADLRTEYEVGIVQAEVDALEKIKLRNTVIILGLVIILILAIGLVTLYSNNLKRSRKLSKALEERRVLLAKHSEELQAKNESILSANEELTVLNEAISKQNEQILEANEELTVLNEAINKQKGEIIDSIAYAERIQVAMMPPEEHFHEMLNDVFILFKPRDIVSGDFYWIKHVNQYVILAAADCTGHGVPGAFMSLLGISYLNEIVQRREITQAKHVLNELRKQIRNSLRQHGQAEESKDGIDMALCVIDKKNNTLQYSGANNPLYLIRDNNGTPELIEFKPDRMPLGYYPGKFKTFANNDIQLEFGDVFYLFSDGFNDQKGGKDGKKFLSKNFKKLLLEIHQEPMQEQKNILEQTLNDWMGSYSQIDDILVLGVRV